MAFISMCCVKFKRRKIKALCNVTNQVNMLSHISELDEAPTPVLEYLKLIEMLASNEADQPTITE
jgi:hypothetical protein